LGGGIASGTLILLVYLSVAFFSAELVLAVYDGFGSGITRWDAVMGSLSLALGINRPTQVVTGGKLATTRQAAGSMTRFGGPGLLVVEDGNAVVLMRRGSVTRIVGPGLYGLESFERVNMVVPLKTIFAEAPLENVATRDGLLIKKLNLLVFANVSPGNSPPVGRACFAFNEDNIRKLWRNFVGTVEVGAVLKDVLGSIANTSVRGVITKYTLDEIFVPGQDGAAIGVRERIKEEAAQAINAITDRFLAINVGAVDIGEIVIAEDAQERLFQYWKADWDQRISRTQARADKSVKEIEAEAERLAMITKARGAADAIALIEEQKREAVQRFVESMLKIAAQAVIRQDRLVQFLTIVEDMCRRVMCDDLTARSYIEALKNMAQGEGARIILPGGQPNFLIGLGEEPVGGKQ
jgi:regulator of protease activity HflC (stomatin/prohibitin superfamily)